MASQDYLEATDDPVHAREFTAEVSRHVLAPALTVAQVIWQLDAEFQFWLGRMEKVEVGGKVHKLARLVAT